MLWANNHSLRISYMTNLPFKNEGKNKDIFKHKSKHRRTYNGIQYSERSTSGTKKILSEGRVKTHSEESKENDKYIVRAKQRLMVSNSTSVWS